MIQKLIKELESKQFDPYYGNGICYALGVISRLQLDEKELNESKTAESDDFFNEFWKAYPKKQAKPAAVRAWRKIKVDRESMFNKIMVAIERHKSSTQWQKQRGQFIPMPSTWLNQERWNDDLGADAMQTNFNNSKFDGI
jgi:hypothetical protein